MFQQNGKIREMYALREWNQIQQPKCEIYCHLDVQLLTKTVLMSKKLTIDGAFDRCYYVLFYLIYCDKLMTLHQKDELFHTGLCLRLLHIKI